MMATTCHELQGEWAQVPEGRHRSVGAGGEKEGARFNAYLKSTYLGTCLPRYISTFLAVASAPPLNKLCAGQQKPPGN